MLDVTVADDVLTAQPGPLREFPGWFNGWYGPAQFLISPPPSSGAAGLPGVGAAAFAAAGRMRLVDASGREVAGTWVQDAEDLPAAVDVRMSKEGIVVSAVGHDLIGPAQADTMVRIILGELYSRRVAAHVSCAGLGDEVYQLPIWGEIEDRGAHDSHHPARLSPKRWWVQRGVQCITTTGVQYQEVEWLQSDGTWNRDMTDAVSIEDGLFAREEATALVNRIRGENTASDQEPHIREPFSVLLARGASSYEMPPDPIRDHGHVWSDPSANA